MNWPILAFSLAALAALPAVSQPHDFSALAPCSEEQKMHWDRLASGTLGAAGWLPERHWIGLFPAEKRILGFRIAKYNWRPQDSVSRVLCGTVNHSKYFYGLFMGKEVDMNNFLRPLGRRGEPFCDFLDLPVLIKGRPKAIKRCRNLNDGRCTAAKHCPEIEVTPAWQFRHGHPNDPRNRWFRFPKGSVMQDGIVDGEGVDLCTYGPWVVEKSHKDRPEIHPSHLLWWRGDDATTYLAAVEDESDRFTQSGSFVEKYGGETRGGNWKPWSQSPTRAQFAYAFRVEKGSPATIELGQVDHYHCNVTSHQDGWPGDLIRDQGNPLLRLAERANGDRRSMKVSTDQVCRIDNTEARGFLLIETTLDSGLGACRAGYQVLSVQRRQGLETPPPGSTEPADPEAEAGPHLLEARLVPEPGSLRASDTGDGLLVTARAYLRVRGLEDEPGALSLTHPDGRSDALHLEVFEDELGVFLRSAPVEVQVQAGGELTLSYAGRSVRAESGQLGLAGAVLDETPVSAQPDAAARERLPEAFPPAGARASGAAPPETLGSAAWDLDLAWIYAPADDEGEVHPEEDWPLTTALNELLVGGDAQQLGRLYGAEPPLTYEVRATAENVTTRETSAVAVEVDPGRNEVGVRLEDGVSPFRQQVRVTFPEGRLAGDVYRVDLVIVATDRFGFTGEVEHETWSHWLDARATLERGRSGIDDELRKLAEKVGVDPDRLLRDSALLESGDSAPLWRAAPAARRIRVARSLRVHMAWVLNDGDIDPGETEQLVRLGEEYKRES